MKHFSLMLALVLFSLSTVIAQRTVTGTVKGDNGEEAIGANVVVEGNESVGTVTEFDGTFSLDVPEDAKALKISYTGFQTQTISIEGKSSIEVVLIEGELLKEAVVIGYSVATREELSSVPSIVGSEEINSIPIATFDNIIQGRAAGVQIMSGSGQPGNSAGKVRIRGEGSINASNTPLYVMDGVPIPAGAFSTINPADIESVTVLKDASQTSIYGARGANGVILITTKRGNFNQEKTQITYSTQMGWSVRSQESFEMMNAAEKLAYELYAGEQGVATAQGRPGFIYGSESSPSYDPVLYDSLANIAVDWSDVVFRTAKQQRHEIGISGGSAKTRFYLSGQYFQQDGTTLASDFVRGTTRFNIDHKASDKFNVGMNMTAGYSRRNSIRSEGGVNLGNAFASAYLNNPYETPRLPDGSYNTGMANVINVIEVAENSTRVLDNFKATGNLFGQYEIIKGLSVRSSWGVDYNQYTGETWIDPNSFDGGQEANGQQGSFGESYSRTTRWIGTNTINFSDYFLEDDKLRFDILLGNELTFERFRSFSYTGYGLNSKLPQTGAGITAGNATNNFIADVGGSKSAESLASFFSRAEFGWDEKYNMSVGFRRDGSSKFGANNRWANFYSVGASWVLSNESFLKGNNLVKYLKLFVNYGTAGNEGLAAFQTFSRYGTGSYGANQTIVLSDIGSDDLKWEVSKQFSFGLDFELLKNNQLQGTVTLYNNTTDDLFLNQTVPASAAGFISALEKNAGSMRNRGVEVELSYDILTLSNGFSWNVYGNYAYNDNEVLDLGQVDEFEQGTSIVREGVPIGSHFEVAWAGVDPSTGQALYYDINGNVTPVYSAANRTTAHGTQNPPHIGGYGTIVSYKGFQVNAFFNFMTGHRLFNNQTFFQENHNFAQFNQKTLAGDLWKTPGELTEVQGIIDPVNGGISRREFSSKDIEDASFLRFRNITLSYSIPSKYLGKVFDSVRITGQAQNLFTWTKFTGFDPEIDNNIAQYEYPVPRTYTIGLDIGF